MIRIPQRIPADTTPEADAVQTRLVRELSPVERVRAAFEASRFVRGLQKMGLKNEHPELTDEEVEARLLELRYGDEKPW